MLLGRHRRHIDVVHAFASTRWHGSAMGLGGLGGLAGLAVRSPHGTAGCAGP